MNEANAFSMVFEDKASLARQYMPFIEQGGLFIRTEEAFALADTISVSLKLPDSGDAYLFSGPVVWVTPPAAERGLPRGIGVQLRGEMGNKVRSEIEMQLAGILDKVFPTDTL